MTSILKYQEQWIYWALWSTTQPLVIDSGVQHKTISMVDFKKLENEETWIKHLIETTKWYPYASKQPLFISGKCLLNAEVPDIDQSLTDAFFVVPQTQVSLLNDITCKWVLTPTPLDILKLM